MQQQFEPVNADGQVVRAELRKMAERLNATDKQSVGGSASGLVTGQGNAIVSPPSVGFWARITGPSQLNANGIVCYPWIEAREVLAGPPFLVDRSPGHSGTVFINPAIPTDGYPYHPIGTIVRLSPGNSGAYYTFFLPHQQIFGCVLSWNPPLPIDNNTTQVLIGSFAGGATDPGWPLPFSPLANGLPATAICRIPETGYYLVTIQGSFHSDGYAIDLAGSPRIDLRLQPVFGDSRILASNSFTTDDRTIYLAFSGFFPAAAGLTFSLSLTFTGYPNITFTGGLGTFYLARIGTPTSLGL